MLLANLQWLCEESTLAAVYIKNI